MTSPDDDATDAAETAEVLRRAAAAWHRDHADRLHAWPAVAERHRLAADVLDALGDALEHHL